MQAITPQKAVGLPAYRTGHCTGPENLAVRTNVGAHLVSWILARVNVPKLGDLDPQTRERLGAACAIGRRHEREPAVGLIHIDVKIIGRSPECGSGGGQA